MGEAGEFPLFGATLELVLEFLYPFNPFDTKKAVRDMRKERQMPRRSLVEPISVGVGLCWQCASAPDTKIVGFSSLLRDAEPKQRNDTKSINS